VALLDLRLFNCDRHEGNVLVRLPHTASLQLDEKLELVPIDHAFVLPRFGYFREAEFAWRYWLAASEPFGSEARSYVEAIDVEADVEVARHAGLGESSCATLRACTMLLKAALLGEGGCDGVTPKVLAGVMMRESIDEPSPFERMCAQALGIADVSEDTALIDYVGADDEGRAANFVPGSAFYAQFAAILEEAYGPRRASSARLGVRATNASGGQVSPPIMRRTRSCVTVPEECMENASLDATGRHHIRLQACKVGAHTDIGGVPFMEDAHCVHRTHAEILACVYDGHGGAQAAHYCRDHLHLNIMVSLERGHAPVDALLAGFARTEANLLSEQQRQQRQQRQQMQQMQQMVEQRRQSQQSQLSRQDQMLLQERQQRQKQQLHLEWLQLMPPEMQLHLQALQQQQQPSPPSLPPLSSPTHLIAVGTSAQPSTGGSMCGATALVALLHEGSVHLAWLGDCRAVLCRGGEAVELTRDHVLSDGADDCGERKRVLSEGGKIESGRLSGFLEVARAFGDVDEHTGRKPAGLSGIPELFSQPLQPDDEFVILGSDGLWRLLDSQAAVRLARADLRAHADVEMAAEKLVEGVLHTRLADDNITALVVLLRPVEPDTSARQRPRLPLMKRAASVPTSLAVAAG